MESARLAPNRGWIAWTAAVAAAALGAAVVTVAAYRLFHTFFGDPTIYLIYARNAAHGDVFSFNPGHFSSGSTSPL